MKKQAILILFIILASLTSKSQQIRLSNYSKFNVKGAVKISSVQASLLRNSITMRPEKKDGGEETFIQVGNTLMAVKESPLKNGLNVLKSIKKLYEASDNGTGNSSEIKTVNGNHVVIAYRMGERGSSIKFVVTNPTGTLSLNGNTVFKSVDKNTAKEAVEELLNTLQFMK